MIKTLKIKWNSSLRRFQKNPSKKILYLDMDGVIADFDHAIKQLSPGLETTDALPNYEEREAMVDKICADNPIIFHTLKPIDGAIEAVNKLFEIYDVYFLSTPMWSLPSSFSGKRLWLEDHFGDLAKKRLILTHRKDLAIGHFLVDDRKKNGAGEFTGIHIHFATKEFPNWEVTFKHLEKHK
jgi:5'-nucleotidase